MSEAKRAGTGDADPLLNDVAAERQSVSTTSIATQVSRDQRSRNRGTSSVQAVQHCEGGRSQRARASASDGRPTPQTTIEAICYAVRERGLDALKEPPPLSGYRAAMTQRRRRYAGELPASIMTGARHEQTSHPGRD